MSRAVRTARGALAASAATLFAAVSHSLAGGSITPVAVMATVMLALPLCVVLAGRLGSLWRLSLAVSLSQLPYHWTFWGLGTTSGPEASGPGTGHAAHLAVVFTPSAVASGAAETTMWISHLLAAVVTIALLHRGEQAALGLARLIRRAFPTALPRPVAIPAAPKLRPRSSSVHPRTLWVGLSSISHRGPPHVLALIH